MPSDDAGAADQGSPLHDKAAGAAAKAALAAVDALNDVTGMLESAAREAGLMNRKGKLRKIRTLRRGLTNPVGVSRDLLRGAQAARRQQCEADHD
jgi:hypothetical protein